jgi:DNA-binding MarR family transcriptional regulator
MSKNRQQQDRSYDIIRSLLELTHRIREKGLRIAAEFDLSPPAASALVELSIGDGPPSMRELAARLRLDPSRVTAIADELEERGFLERRVDPANRRIKLLVATTAGLAAHRSMMDSIMEQSPLAHLSDPDQRVLAALLKSALDVPPPPGLHGSGPQLVQNH